MIYYIKHFFSYVIISVLSVILFGALLIFQGDPDDAVGMAPRLILLNCIMAASITFALLLLLRIKTKIALTASTCLFAIIYCLVLFFFFDPFPFEKDIDMARNVNTLGYLCLLLSFILFNLSLAIRRTYLSKKNSE